ncbi:hypothetical protein CPC08DRAFT_715573 [Agrocybe pediades]|nr:hypothetical protein CPC08DRAFT_715573 [Agrocybe pediades]
MRRACDKWIQAYFDDFPPQSIHVSEHGQQHIHKLIIGDSRAGLQLMVVDSGHPFIPMLGASSAFSAVTHLRIHPGPQLAFWAPLCKAFHSVIELSVEGPGAKTEELFDIVNQLFLFPSLRTLQWDVEGMDLFPKILIFLEHRASIGSPLSALCLKPVDIDRLSDAHRDRLDKIVGLVLRATP